LKKQLWAILREKIQWKLNGRRNQITPERIRIERGAQIVSSNFLQSRANQQCNSFEVTEINQHLTENPPQCIFCSMMAFPQNRV
jgi:hypothetical protein